MKLIKLSPDYKLKFKSEIPKDTKNKIYAMFNQLNVVKYPSSDHEIVDTKLTLATQEWGMLYPKYMFAKFSEANDLILKISCVRISTEDEVILGASNHKVHHNFKVIL
ncbi:hypothetical protein [Priestia megaterium]|uniref:Uncharacterized protein n=1 Tax=Priestia megaterium TaxID=1404 RepID=A0A6M6E539_PRIMG|nr:hypothetical protein [Priestia megaterium]QJX80289.1 hypothetical protein FDZ14_29795 [Priestia megaterium]